MLNLTTIPLTNRNKAKKINKLRNNNAKHVKPNFLCKLFVRCDQLTYFSHSIFKYTINKIFQSRYFFYWIFKIIFTYKINFIFYLNLPSFIVLNFIKNKNSVRKVYAILARIAVKHIAIQTHREKHLNKDNDFGIYKRQVN